MREPLAAGLHQLAEGVDAGIAAPVLVGRDHRLGSAGTPRQLGLGQPMPAPDVADQLGCAHPSERIGSSMYLPSDCVVAL